jgi:hypothetical protein
MTNERELTDEQILETFRSVRDAHSELLNTVGKMHETLLAMSKHLNLLQQKVLDLERRLDHALR